MACSCAFTSSPVINDSNHKKRSAPNFLDDEAEINDNGVEEDCDDDDDDDGGGEGNLGGTDDNYSFSSFPATLNKKVGVVNCK